VFINNNPLYKAAMSAIEEYDFSDFSFCDLVLFIRDMYSTFKVCSQKLFSCGIEFIGVEHLKEKIDLVSKELKKRIRKVWKPEYIRNNLLAGVRLPSEIINFPSISEDLLITTIWRNEGAINAELKEDFEEIYVIHFGKKYKMTRNGEIIIESIKSTENRESTSNAQLASSNLGKN
jgi:hypothetical protein